MKSLKIFPLIFGCSFIGLLGCNETNLTKSPSNLATGENPIEKVELKSQNNSNQVNNRSNNRSNQNPESSQEKNSLPTSNAQQNNSNRNNPDKSNQNKSNKSNQSKSTLPPKGQDWIVIANENWTINIGQKETWEGSNNTGNLTYYGCDNLQRCLGLTGGKVFCDEDTCDMYWKNGDYTYILKQPIYEYSSHPTDLVVTQNNRVILEETGFEVIESSETILDPNSL